jgi:NAD(P)-dependent dehydrogenase (short-subunit alcohol dehydrogenase family)
VNGFFFSVQKGLPFMNDGGSIILNASIAATKGFPGMSVYSATKAAVRSFARTWTNDLCKRRIRVNAISPVTTFQDWSMGGVELLVDGDVAQV